MVSSKQQVKDTYGLNRLTEASQLNHDDQRLLDEYVQEFRLMGRTEETTRSHKTNVRIVGRYLNSIGQGFLDVDKQILKKILDYLKNTRKVQDKTLECYFTALSTFYEFLTWEEYIKGNPIPAFRNRYLKRYKDYSPQSKLQVITVEQMAMLINGTFPIRDKALMTTLAKTGVRRGELMSMDVEDINWEKWSIKLKPKHKRSNLVVYFDQEAAIILSKWLRVRSDIIEPGEKALFVGDRGGRLGRNVLYQIVVKHAKRMGLHNPNTRNKEQRFSPHCFRHWFTTNLRRNGMNREFIKELRGDTRGQAIDIYDRIDPEELRKAYLNTIPRLGLV